MGRTHDAIPEHLAEWLTAQHVFFVGTAPSGADGHVNVSPKGGTGSFAVIDEHTVAYLDFNGSGIETVAHLRDNGRITIMFCAFDGPPNIVRLQGRGEVILATEPEAAPYAEVFGPLELTRAIVVVHVTRVSSSCGYGVPLMAYEADRDDLGRWAERKGVDGLATYRAEKNATSIDGLPGLTADGLATP